MKNSVVLFFICILHNIVLADNFDKIYYFNDDYVFVKTVYNKKNCIVARQEYRVKETDTKFGEKKVTGETITIKNGKRTETTSSTFLCDANRLMISLGKSKTGQNVFIDYPLNYSAGRKIIPSAEFITVANIAGKSIKLNCKISNRFVSSASEKVHTKFGTFQSVKYEYDMELKGGVLGINIPVNVHVIEWFSNNTGVIRTDIYRAGKLHERRELSEMMNRKLLTENK